MATDMVIVQNVDKCIRCNGCVISCKRTWKMKAANNGVNKVAADERVVIKSRRKTDMGEFTRYSCWHCENPPCASRCPFTAIKKHAVTGAVYVDHRVCNPGGTNSRGVTCTQQCLTDCGRGGYPRIGVGSDDYATSKMYKCSMCVDSTGYSRAGAGGDLPTKDSRAAASGSPENAYNHQPACVFTCPAKAMSWEKRDEVLGVVDNPEVRKLSSYYSAVAGTGQHIFWVSDRVQLLPPKADPYIEDHITPMVSGLLSSPFAKAALVPTLVVGGLMALSARRVENEVRVQEGEV